MPQPSPESSPTPLAGPTVGVACSLPDEPIPGTYVDIVTQGTVTGAVYRGGAPSNNESYGIQSFATAAPTASMSSIAHVVVTARTGPIYTTSAVPVPSSSPEYTIYSGTYHVPAFGSVNTTDSCFSLKADSNSLAAGDGFPNEVPFSGSYTMSLVGSGSITNLEIDNISPSTGTGSFLLDNGVTGSIAITGSQSFYPLPQASNRRNRATSLLPKRLSR